MRFLCLCPIYNHPKRLIENAIACFAAQTHWDATLLIGDDGPGYPEVRTIFRDTSAYRMDVHVTRFPKRLDSIGEKCQEMYRAAVDIGIQFDAIALWDDDDIYLRHHLALMAGALGDPGVHWAKSLWVGSTFGGELHLEDSAGRFWASIGIKREQFEKIGGFVQTKAANFDQQMLSKLRVTSGEPASFEPTYVYRWEDTEANHCSGAMSTPDDETWWDKVPCAPAEGDGVLRIRFDKTTDEVYRKAPRGFLERPIRP
jgi:hypothetical protein